MYFSPSIQTSSAPTSATPGPTSSTTHAPNGAHIGTIIGGVVGGVSFLIILAVAIFLLHRRSKHRDEILILAEAKTTPTPYLYSQHLMEGISGSSTASAFTERKGQHRIQPSQALSQPSIGTSYPSPTTASPGISRILFIMSGCLPMPITELLRRLVNNERAHSPAEYNSRTDARTGAA